MSILKKLNKWLAWPGERLIVFYQRTLSPDSGYPRYFYPYGFCRYQPHCSEYGRQALSRYGLLPGLFKAMRRVGRCHPWAAGGHDPLR